MNHDGLDGLSRDGPEGRRLRRLLQNHATRVFALALIVAFGLQWKSCVEPNRMHPNWREFPQWRAASSQQFHPDDRLLRYQRFNAGPFANAIYTTLSRAGIDVAWGKINGILWFACTAVLIFLTAGAMVPGKWAGWVAAATFALFPSNMELFVGGFMSGLSVPLLCLTVLVAFTGRWWCSVPLVALQCLVYPMAALQSALLLVLVCVCRPKTLLDRDAWRRQLVPVMLAAATCVAVVATKFLGAQSEFGELVSRVDIGDRLEFAGEGLAPLLPTPSMLASVSSHLGSISYVTTCLLAFLALGRRMLRLPRGVYALLFSSVSLLWLADVMVLRLDVPESYVARAAPLFVALTTGLWVARMIARERRHRTIVEVPLVGLRVSAVFLGVCLLAMIALIEHRESFAPSGDLDTRHFRRVELYEAVRQLPGGVMLASHPRLASELPLMTGRSVVISSKSAHPWWTKHWAWCEERLRDVLRAYYADDPQTLVEVSRKYGIDYWIVDEARYRGSSLERGGMYYEPFKSWAREHLRLDGYSILRQVPRRYRRWEDGGGFFIVAAADVERYAEELASQGARIPDRKGR